ncbi:MAG: hypothetical protein ABI603_05490 [Acidobacteriota bacterium]
MSMFSGRARLPVAILLLGCLAGCGLGQNLQVTSLQLGKSLNSDGTVATHTTRFGPADTIYLSVLTSGAGHGVIGVRWTYAGQTMGEPKKQVSYRDVAATEFHLQSAGGFPVGDYTVEAFFDDRPVGTKEFRVE